MKGYEDGLRVLSRGEELCGEVAAVDIVASLVKTIAAGVDGRQVVLHLVVGIGPTVLVVGPVEEGAGPEQQHTTLEGKGCTCGDTSVVVACPSTVGGLFLQHRGGLVQVVEDEVDAGLCG